ncbi:hypothetical protein [Methyloversatilis sp. XJ19-49]|uniref:hypothetical protein n=1 Tax=Methyloversatilis sp. XJ19-49 TaxID=2963429 RepID=UPI00211C995F|nr:hypothetical protein [Methyloversatilis sp. XJ19-49]MCQ9377665.1 hypothetical protein [Methyloversatilis sp. XJ19-49]
MRTVHAFQLFADYFQFVVQDEESDDDFATIWTEDALSALTAFGRSAVCPGTLRNVEVPVEVVVSDHEPLVALEDVEHAVEGSIEIPSGKVVVMGCTQYFPDAPRFNVTPGTYRALAVMSGIKSIQNEWDPADDKYTVYLWPGSSRQPKLLKHWNSDA